MGCRGGMSSSIPLAILNSWRNGRAQPLFRYWVFSKRKVQGRAYIFFHGATVFDQ